MTKSHENTNEGRSNIPSFSEQEGFTCGTPVAEWHSRRRAVTMARVGYCDHFPPCCHRKGSDCDLVVQRSHRGHGDEHNATLGIAEY